MLDAHWGTLLGTQDLWGEVPSGPQVTSSQGWGQGGWGLLPSHKGLPHVRQTTGEVALDQNVGTLDAPMSDGGFPLVTHQGGMKVGQSRAGCGSHSEEVDQGECASICSSSSSSSFSLSSFSLSSSFFPSSSFLIPFTDSQEVI